jgi:hypothetical protein
LVSDEAGGRIKDSIFDSRCLELKVAEATSRAASEKTRIFEKTLE